MRDATGAVCNQFRDAVASGEVEERPWLFRSTRCRPEKCLASPGEGRGYRFWNSFKQSWMQIVDDAQLEMLTVKELRDLKDRIDLAIRAVIRASRAPKAAETTKAPDPVKFDLERERDAWLLAKK